MSNLLLISLKNNTKKFFQVKIKSYLCNQISTLKV